MQATENLRVRREGGTLHYCCVKCDTDLGTVRDNYKEHCLREDNTILHAAPLSGDPQRYIDARPEFRQFFCPGCGALVENEIALKGEPLLRDLEVVGEPAMQLRSAA